MNTLICEFKMLFREMDAFANSLSDGYFPAASGIDYITGSVLAFML